MKIATLAVLIMIGGTVSAGACEIEDWLWEYDDYFEWVFAHGTTTCEAGKITIRAYDGSGEFLGAGWGYIRGYVFDVTFSAVLREPPLKLKPTIKPY